MSTNQAEPEIIDLEEYAAQGKKPPKDRRYRIKVNKEPFVFNIPNPTREQILETAGLVPTDKWDLRLKINGGHRLIRKGERVDLTEPGVEKFKAITTDQTDG